MTLSFAKWHEVETIHSSMLSWWIQKCSFLGRTTSISQRMVISHRHIYLPTFLSMEWKQENDEHLMIVRVEGGHTGDGGNIVAILWVLSSPFTLDNGCKRFSTESGETKIRLLYI